MGAIYRDVGTLMSVAFSAEKINETRSHWAEYKQTIADEGKEYTFGGFAAYLFAKWGTYDDPERNGVPRSASQWSGSTGSMPADVRARLAGWVRESLEGDTRPVAFFVGEHEGETTADRFENGIDVFIIVMCKARPVKAAAQMEGLRRIVAGNDISEPFKP